MTRFVILAAAVVLAGCSNAPVDTADTDAGNTSQAAAVDSGAVTVSYSTGDKATLAIPEMHCPFACFPKAKETLEAIDGVASVELVKQKEEGVIDDRRVVVTFDGSVDSGTAIAALDKAELTGSAFEAGEATSEN